MNAKQHKKRLTVRTKRNKRNRNKVLHEERMFNSKVTNS